MTKLFGTSKKINIISTTWMAAESIMKITLGIGIIGWGYWFKYLDSGKIIKTRDDAGKIPHRL